MDTSTIKLEVGKTKAKTGKTALVLVHAGAFVDEHWCTVFFCTLVCIGACELVHFGVHWCLCIGTHCVQRYPAGSIHVQCQEICTSAFGQRTWVHHVLVLGLLCTMYLYLYLDLDLDLYLGEPCTCGTEVGPV